MGRTRGFDEATVLDAAAGAFGRLGYAGASVDALVAATGLHRGSLYGAYGSKHGLFTAALRHSCDAAEAAADHAPSAAGTALLLVALVELAAEDAEVRALAGRLLTAMNLDASALGARLLDRAAIPAHTLTEEET